MSEPTESETPEQNSGSPQPLVEVPPPSENPPPITGAQTSSFADLDPEAPLFVPVTNVNYVPGGVERLEGFVPDTPGDDRTLNRIKMALETQGLESGPVEDGPPNGPPAEEEAEPASEPVDDEVTI